MVNNEIKFQWDEKKNQSNVKKHGIDFDTAAKVFGDPNRLELWYEDHSRLFEDRFKTIGMLADAIIIISVIYTERGDAIRIISARPANKEEVFMYYGYSN